MRVRHSVTQSLITRKRRAEINCTVRLPTDSQFTVKDDIDCISGSIIANNVGVSESEIKQPFMADPPKRTRVAHNSKKKSKKRKAKTSKRKLIAKASAKTPVKKNARKSKNKKPKASKNKAETLLTAADIHAAEPQEVKVEMPISTDNELVHVDIAPTETVANNQNAGTIPLGPGVAIVQDVVSAGAAEVKKAEVAKKKQKRSSNVVLRSPATAYSGSLFAVKWQGPDQPYDYITVVSTSAKQGAYSHYVYTKEGAQAVLNAPPEPGKYEVRYVDGNTQRTLARRVITIR